MRGKRLFIMVLVLSVCGVTAAADKIARLPEVMKPFYLTVSRGRIFISEENSQIHIYTLDLPAKKTAHLKTFGTLGQGPGEFSFIHQMKVVNDRLIVPTMGKYAEFTLDGGFLSEIKVTVPVFKNKIEALGSCFAVGNLNIRGGQNGRSTVRMIKLYDADFNLVRELKTFAYDNRGKPINLFAPTATFSVAGGNIYVICADERATVEVFDGDGRLTNTIHLPLEPMKISQDMEDQRVNVLKAEMAQDAERWKRVQAMIFYPRTAPPLEYAWVTGERLYVRTYRRQHGQAEMILYDLDGREVKRGWVHDSGMLSRGRPFDFIGDQFIYLRLDDEGEYWELWLETIGAR